MFALQSGRFNINYIQNIPHHCDMGRKTGWKTQVWSISMENTQLYPICVWYITPLHFRSFRPIAHALCTNSVSLECPRPTTARIDWYKSFLLAFCAIGICLVESEKSRKIHRIHWTVDIYSIVIGEGFSLVSTLARNAEKIWIRSAGAASAYWQTARHGCVACTILSEQWQKCNKFRG